MSINILTGTIEGLKKAYVKTVNRALEERGERKRINIINYGRKRIKNQRRKEEESSREIIVRKMANDPEVRKFYNTFFGLVSTHKCQRTKASLARMSRVKSDLIRYLMNTYGCNSEVAKMAIPKWKHYSK